MLPNFLCIGAQKCGTTTIWRLLDAHPDVFMARPRETRFFCDSLQYAGGTPRYEVDYFSDVAHHTAVGEKCPEYLYVPGVAQRVFDGLGPDTKFIVALRDPGQRAFSHYRHNLASLQETRSFQAAVDDEAETLSSGKWPAVPFGYLSRGLYARQLAAYLELFPPENFLFVSFEREIVHAQPTLARRLYRFLGLPDFDVVGLPFRDGRLPLETMTVRTQASDSKSGLAVEIVERRFSRQQKGLRFWPHVKRRLTGHSETQVVQRPSSALLALVDAFGRNQKAAAQLSSEEAQALSRRVFADDIAMLSRIIPFSTDEWRV